ncbi:MAG: hypothetical protein JWM41_1732 [Gemmatimonadetes bacterium]|nr:hypothetical protein [Gemmatimonadota bacterium]
MPHRNRMRVVFHGAVVLLVGLLCGMPTVPEQEPMRLWHTAHESLILIGILLLAMSSVLPVLELERREAEGLVWSLLATGYGLMTGLIIQGVTGVHAFGPSTSPLRMLAFVGNATGMLGSVLTAALTLMGARAARVTEVARAPAI